MIKKHTFTVAVATGVFAIACLAATTSARADLVGYWTFDDTLNDSSGNANHGTYNGAAGSATYSTDVAGAIGSGKSIYLNSTAVDEAGKDEFVRVTHSASLLFDQDLSFSFWMDEDTRFGDSRAIG